MPKEFKITQPGQRQHRRPGRNAPAAKRPARPPRSNMHRIHPACRVL